MKHISAILIIVGIVFLSVSGALATSYTLETAATPILLLGTGLIGLVGFRRTPRKN